MSQEQLEQQLLDRMSKKEKEKLLIWIIDQL